MTKKTSDPASVEPEQIAVIGMGCRFSGEASSIEGFWDMLRSGRQGHGRVPTSRFEASAWHHPNAERKGAINHDSGFFVEEDPARFDAPFFSITAKEAAGMDPVQRLLLEVAYETFENGGIPMESLPGSTTGVYSGCMTNDYELLSTRDIYDMPHNSATGNGRTMLANRLSWFFDLRGPSVMMDTACSSSLTALHLATQSLRAGDCNMALVTGASLILYPNFTQRLSYMHMLSPDGISHSFDSKANGYGRGEGFGAVLLKPLTKALSDGDVIRAIVRATGSNQDGRTPGITMPNATAQADLICSTYRKAHLSMHETAYFEAHGTGTEIGDPTELAAIGQSFGAQRLPGNEPVFVGSVKSNIGHTEGAAGVASIIKVILCLEEGLLVPNAGFSNKNPRIRLDEWGLRLSNTTMPWPAHLIQRASINSFGFGGSNAHAIIESAAQYLGAPVRSNTQLAKDTPQIVVFSTHDKAGLDRTAEKWESYLKARAVRKPYTTVQDIAFTMCTRRSQLAFRSFVVADSIEQLQSTLVEGLPSISRAGRKHQNQLAFIYTGQGAQWARMGMELLDVPAFAESMEHSHRILQSLDCPWNLIKELEASTADSRIDDPERSQPICCAIQIALTKMLNSWGVYPKAVVGHSSGEAGAAYAAGYLSHEDAICITYYRGVFSQRIAQNGKRGGMMAVGISASDAKRYLELVPPNSVVVGCINSPSSITLSGDEDHINELESRLKADGYFARKLQVTNAYHSPHMSALAKEYGESISSIIPENRLNDTVTMFSTVTEEHVYTNDLVAKYWVRNLTSPVQFLSAVSKMVTMTEAGKGRRRATPIRWGGFLEIGPHHAMKGPFSQTLQEANADLTTLPYNSILVRKKDALQTTLQIAGALWCTGYDIDINAVNQSILKGESPQMTCKLPSYAWNHQTTFWHEPLESSRLRQRKLPRHDLLGTPFDYQNNLEPRWRNFLRVSEMPWIADHVVAGSIVYPAAGMVAMVAEAARQLADSTKWLEGIEFQDLDFFRGMVIPADERGLETVLHIAPEHGLFGWYKFGIFSLAEGSSWIQHAKGSFVLHYDMEEEIFSNIEWEHTVKRVMQTQHTAIKAETEAVYNWLSQTGGVTLGPTFRSMSAVSFHPNSNKLYVSGVVPDTRKVMPHECESSSFIHPTSLDALFQAAVLSCSNALSNQEANIPIGVDRLLLLTSFSLKPSEEFAIHTETLWNNGKSRSESIASSPSWRQPGVILQGIRLGRVPMRSNVSGSNSKRDHSRYSSFIWMKHLDSCTSTKTISISTDNLRDWVMSVSQTIGDGNALVIANRNRTGEIIEAFEGVAPQIIFRPRLQHIDIVIVGPNDDEISQERKLQEALPGCRVSSLSSFEDVDLSASGETTFDMVLLDIQEGWDTEYLQNLFQSLLSRTAIDVCMAVKTTSECRETAINSIKILAEWDLREVSEQSDLLFIRKRAPPLEFDPVIYVLVREHSDISKSLFYEMEQIFAKVGSQLSIIAVHEVENFKGKTVISLAELDCPWVVEWTSQDMEQFRAVLHAKYVLWILQSSGEASVHASSGGTTGLLRTLRNELPHLTLTQLQVDHETMACTDILARNVLQVMNITLQPMSRSPDWEFLLTNNSLLIPRAVAADSVDDAMSTLLHGPKPVSANLASDSRPLMIQSKMQDLSQAYWELDHRLENALAPDQVEVQVHLVSISDQSQKTKVAPEALFSGIEAIGKIYKVGSAVTKEVAVGDLVIVAISSHSLLQGLTTRVRVSGRVITKSPSILDPLQAVSMPLAYATAYYSLFGDTQVLHAQALSSVLIISSANRTMKALVECALAAGLQTYIALDDHDDVQALQSEYPTLKEQIFFLHNDLESTISRLTGGDNVEIAISCLAGSVGRLAGHCLRPGGRLIDLSEKLVPAALSRSFTERGCTFTSLRMPLMLREKAENFKDVFQCALDLLVRNGRLVGAKQHHPVFPASRISEGFAHARETGMRAIIDLLAPNEVPIVPHLPDPVKLSGEHVYLLVGGLGTLGLALAETLVDCGARNLVFVTRSGIIHKQQGTAVAGLQKRGVQTDVVCCDITCEKDVHALKARAQEQGWKLRGIIQCATVLRDSMFENMTFDEWKNSTESKIQGTYNLHTYFLEDHLDFFITLSSVASVIGNMGQANYSAGNAYMDALAVWRRDHNLPGNSINIGLVPDSSGVNDIAESPEQRQQRYAHLKGTEIDTDELRALVKLIVQGTVSVPPQIIAGMIDTLPRDGAASWQFDRKFDHRIQPLQEDQSNLTVKTSSLLKKAASVTEAVGIINGALQAYLAKAMAASNDSIDMDLPLSSLGVDSLKAAEVQNWVSREMGSELSSFEFLGSQPARLLAEKIATGSTFVTVK